MKRFFLYQWSLVRQAFRFAWSVLDTVATLVGIVVPVLVTRLPTLKTWSDTLLWLTPCVAASAFVVVRLALAPYQLHRQAADAAQQREAEWRSKCEKLETQLADRASRRSVRDQLAAFMADGRRIRGRCVSEEATPEVVQSLQNDAEQWASRASAYLRQSLEPSFVERFRDASGLPVPGFPDNFSVAFSAVWCWMYARLARLGEFIRELG
jgi:hypothetical protein